MDICKYCGGEGAHRSGCPACAEVEKTTPDFHNIDLLDRALAYDEPGLKKGAGDFLKKEGKYSDAGVEADESQQRTASPEGSAEKREVAPEERSKVISAWNELVLGHAEQAPDKTLASDQELNEWLNNSLEREYERLVEELGFETDASRMEEISRENDPSRRAELELNYIREAVAAVQERVKNFDRSGTHSTKWDSWPAAIRETREFNCAGATGIGKTLLERAGVEQYLGKAAGHVVNVAKLSNGDWWFVDFMNGERVTKKIEPAERELAGQRALEFRDPDIDYRLVLLRPKNELASSVLGNMAHLKRTASEPGAGTPDIERLTAKKYMGEHAAQFASVDFQEVSDRLNEKEYEAYGTNDYEREEARVRKVHALSDVGRDYLNSLNKDRVTAIANEASADEKGLRDFFFGGDEAVLDRATPELAGFLKALRHGLEKVRETDRETYDDHVERLLVRLRSIKK